LSGSVFSPNGGEGCGKKPRGENSCRKTPRGQLLEAEEGRGQQQAKDEGAGAVELERRSRSSRRETELQQLGVFSAGTAAAAGKDVGAACSREGHRFVAGMEGKLSREGQHAAADGKDGKQSSSLELGVFSSGGSCSRKKRTGADSSMKTSVVAGGSKHAAGKEEKTSDEERHAAAAAWSWHVRSVTVRPETRFGQTRFGKECLFWKISVLN
jgi:hypothetical protein